MIKIQNIKFGSLKNWDLRFIWNLVLEIWDLNEFILRRRCIIPNRVLQIT